MRGMWGAEEMKHLLTVPSPDPPPSSQAALTPECFMKIVISHEGISRDK